MHLMFIAHLYDIVLDPTSTTRGHLKRSNAKRADPKYDKKCKCQLQVISKHPCPVIPALACQGVRCSAGVMDKDI